METHFWILVGFGVLVSVQLASIARSLASICGSLESTAAMTKRLLSHQGIAWDATTEPSARVKELALDARTYVDAIKAYREQTGLGLREAKSVIDGLPRHRPGAA